MPIKTEPQDLINYWIYEVGSERWYTPDPKLDGELREKFSALHEAAARNELRNWEDTPEGVLALMLLLDFFPRRMFAGKPEAFANNSLAVILAREAVIRHFDDRIDRSFKMFFYLPFLYSEDDGDQRLALFFIRERAKDPYWTALAEIHSDEIMRFNRFPSRNSMLGRESTPEEVSYLKAPPRLAEQGAA